MKSSEREQENNKKNNNFNLASDEARRIFLLFHFLFISD